MGFSIKNKMVPAEVLRGLSEGSFEHLSLRLDEAIADNTRLFFAKSEDVTRVATFKDKVTVGTADGKFYSCVYEDRDGEIHFGTVTKLEAEAIDPNDSQDYVNKFMFDTVDKLLSGDADSQKEHVLALMNLKESIEEEGQDLATLVIDIVASSPAWKTSYKENFEQITKNITNLSESLKPGIDLKYQPLYDGTLPEEKFHLYLDVARRDLGEISDRLTDLETQVETSYLPFSSMSLDNVSNPEDKATINEFISFADGLASEVHDICEHVKIAIKNEQCAMCLGQIHDAIAGSLSDYEVAGLFVKQMATQFTA